MYNTINDKNQNRRGSLTYYNNGGLKQLWTSNQQIKEEGDDIQEIPVGLSANDAWKIVGSPPRRMSLSGPAQQVPDDSSTNHNNTMNNFLNVEDYSESTRRRNRAASTPLPPMNNEMFSFNPFTPMKNGLENPEVNDFFMPNNHSKQWSDVSWSNTTHGKSIWNNDSVSKPSVTITTAMDNENTSEGGNYNIYLNHNSAGGIHSPSHTTATTNPNTSATTTSGNGLDFGPSNEKMEGDGHSEGLGRQYRSSSFSLGSFGIHQPINEVDETEGAVAMNPSDLQFLKPTMNYSNGGGNAVGGHGGYDVINTPTNGNPSFLSFPYEMPKVRSRSKSSSEIYGKFSDQAFSHFNSPGGLGGAGDGSYSPGMNDLNANLMWGNNNLNNVNLLSALLSSSSSSRPNSSVNSPLNGLSPLTQLMAANEASIHRRSSTQPIYSNIWSTNGNVVGETTTTPTNVNNPNPSSSSTSMAPTISSTLPHPSSMMPSSSATTSNTPVSNNNNLLSPQMGYYANLTSATTSPTTPTPTTPTDTTPVAAVNTSTPTTPQTTTNSNLNNQTTITPTTSSNPNPMGLGFNQRRYSNAPIMNEENLQNENPERRHSLPDPSMYSVNLLNGNINKMTSNTEKAQNDDNKSKALSTHDSDYVNEIDDYFENTEHRTRAWVEAGKNLQSQQSSQHWPIYIIEFKAGRTDYFYISENSGLIVKVNDLVIVEADRGKDLGKVVASNITSFQQIQMFHAQHSEEGMEQLQKDMQIHPKRIYRMAQSAEIDMLIAKCQDEVKAKNLCQGKVRQRKLPMEIVDAEYQWDRKKLTFYFVSDRRIDFRELVRELFKIYKTRIWMCAVSSIPN